MPRATTPLKAAVPRAGGKLASTTPRWKGAAIATCGPSQGPSAQQRGYSTLVRCASARRCPSNPVVTHQKKETPPLPQGQERRSDVSVGLSDQNWKLIVPTTARGLPIWANGTEYCVVAPPENPPT